LRHYAGCIKLVAEVSELFAYAVFHLFVIPQDGDVGAHPLEDQKDGSQRVLNWVCRKDEGEQTTSFR
jgi:hypothetical protein